MSSKDDIPPHVRPWLERTGLVEIGHIPMRDAALGLLRSVPTMHHAVRLFDMVERALGERAWRDPARPPDQGCLYLRDPERPGWTFGVPVLDFEYAGLSTVTVAVFSFGPEAPKAPPLIAPDITPSGPMMRPGKIVIREGPASFQIEFGEGGVARGACESQTDGVLFAYCTKTKPYSIDPLARPPTPRPLSILCRADLSAGGYPLERFAELVAGLACSTPARLLVPGRTPLFATGHLMNGIANLRRALWHERIPADAAWAVADAYDGVALGWGATADQAVALWKEELFRKKPKAPEVGPPPSPSPPPEKPEAPRTHKDEEGRIVGYSTGTITVTGGGGGPAIPWPRAVPSNIPGVLVPLGPASGEVPPAFASAGFAWKRIVGARGDAHAVLCRPETDGEADGFILVGAGVHDLVDPGTLDADVAAGEATQRQDWPSHIPSPWDDPQTPGHVATYVCFDNLHRRRMPCTHTASNFGGPFDPGMLDGDSLHWGVTRVRVRRSTST